MKYNTLKASFKNGMISPRLRGREKEGDITSSAEVLENFNIDRIGAAVKRGNIDLPLVQPFLNTGSFAYSYDSNPTIDMANTAYFSLEIRGKKYILKFDKTFSFNAISNGVNPSTKADFQSKFLTIFDELGVKQDTRVYAPYYTASAVGTDLSAFNKSLGATPVDSGLSTYLYNLKTLPTHMVKISDATAVFTCADSIADPAYSSMNGLSFSISLIQMPQTIGSSTNIEVFVILPYFINLVGFLSNLGKSITTTVTNKYRCPIHCSNFPFNTINTNLNHTISTSIVAGQSGTAGTNKELVLTDSAFVYLVDVPSAICLLDNNSTDPSALLGKFILLPSDDNLYDIPFFITKYDSVPSAGKYRFLAIKTVFGTPEVNTTRWKLSTFGGYTHPKVVNYCFNRLVYANAGRDSSTWWASAIHPDNVLNFQGFMQFSLLQDAAGDVSKLLYNGVSFTTIQDNWQKYGVTDPYRYGFSSKVPNLQPIMFIESRRRIHFGTFGGECQLTINDGTFNKASYEQIKVRSNSATLNQTANGDGKFFYISNYGQDIRFISTEDKDYESIDGLLTTALEGLNLYFTKIIWVEHLNSLIARSEYFDWTEFKLKYRFFSIAVHEDTQIKAITEFKFNLEVIDMTCVSDILYFVFRYEGYQHYALFNDDPSFNGDMSFTSFSGDLSLIIPFFINKTIKVFFKGQLYDYTFTSVALNPGDFPIDLSEVSNLNPLFLYGKSKMCKIKTMPITDGGGNNSAVGDIQRVDRVIVQVDNSGPFKIGIENGTIYEAEGLDLGNLKTKYVKYDMPQSTDIENHIYLESDSPTPLNISGISYRGVSYSGE